MVVFTVTDDGTPNLTDDETITNGSPGSGDLDSNHDVLPNADGEEKGERG